MGEAEDAVSAEPPAQLEDAVRGLIERAVPDLRAEIVERGMDWADVAFGAGNQFLDRAVLCRVEQGARSAAARRLDLLHQSRQSRLVRAPRHHRVIAAGGKTQGGIAPDPGARADHKEHGFAAIGHGWSLPSAPQQQGYWRCHVLASEVGYGPSENGRLARAAMPGTVPGIRESGRDHHQCRTAVRAREGNANE